MSTYKYKNPILEIFSFEEIKEIFENQVNNKFLFKNLLFVYSLEAITEEIFNVYLDEEFVGELLKGTMVVIGAEGIFIASKEHCEKFYEKCLVS